LTVAAALLILLLAPVEIYRGLGPVLAIGIGVLLSFLTLTPRCWPSSAAPRSDPQLGNRPGGDRHRCGVGVPHAWWCTVPPSPCPPASLCSPR
jgi:hypothetical protein